MNKTLFLISFLLMTLFFSAQTDTIVKRDSTGKIISKTVVYNFNDGMTWHPIDNESKGVKGRIFGGFGNGGEKNLNWFASGVWISINYKWHTVSAFGSIASKRASDSHYGSYYELLNTNGGIIYGPGFYGRNAFINCGIGYGNHRVSYTYLTFTPGSAPGGSPVGHTKSYRERGFCMGVQAGAGGEKLKFTAAAFAIYGKKIYYTYSVLFGVSFGIQ